MLISIREKEKNNQIDHFLNRLNNFNNYLILSVNSF